MSRRTLTPQSLKSLVPPPTGQLEFWDPAVRGFACRVSAGGVKSWVLAYRVNGRTRWWTLGRYPELSLTEARKRAQRALVDVADGKDPGSEKIAQRRASTFGELAEEYRTAHAKRKKRSWKYDQYILDKELLPYWRHCRVVDLTRRDVRALLERIADPDGRNGPIHANRVRACIHKIFNFALPREYGLTYNPCTGVERPGIDRARERVLTSDELRAFWQAVEIEGVARPPAGVFFKLRILTGQRGSEVAHMRWGDVDFSTNWWVLPGEFAKNGRQHRVPLSPPAATLLKDLRAWTETRTAEINRGRDRKGWVTKPVSDWVFPTPRKGKADDGGDRPRLGTFAKAMSRIRAESGIQDVCAHDLRRTAASLMSEMGVPRLTLKKVLNHVDRDITAVYDRYSYDPEKREALHAWARRVEAILEGRDNLKVLRFRGQVS